MKEETFKESSELRFYSVGVVFKGNSTISGTTGNVNSVSQIKVSPIETMNAQKQGPIEEFNTVTAEWLAISQPNRTSAPNVYPNQSVMLYKYANTEQYFWVTMRNEADLQRAETAIYAFSNIPADDGWETDTKPVSMNASNSYFISIGGSGIFVTTPDNRGEVAKYRIGIDCKNGKISISDNLSNSLTLDSKKGNLVVETKTRIHLKTPGLMTLEAKDVSVKGTFYTDGDINCKGDVKTGGSLNSGGNVNCSGLVKHNGLIPGGSGAAPKTPPSEVSIDRANASALSSADSINITAGISSQLAATAGAVAGGAGVGGTASAAGGLTSLGLGSAVAAGNAAMGTVTGAVNNATGLIGSAVSGITDTATGLVNSATSAVTDTINSTIDSGLNMVNSTISSGIDAVNSVADQATATLVQAATNTVSGVRAATEAAESLAALNIPSEPGSVVQRLSVAF